MFLDRKGRLGLLHAFRVGFRVGGLGFREYRV